MAAHGTQVGRYFLQASIAEQHARAVRVEDTDWRRIAGLYDVLSRAGPGPVVEVNRAVATGGVRSGAGLAVLEDLDADSLATRRWFRACEGTCSSGLACRRRRARRSPRQPPYRERGPTYRPAAQGEPEPVVGRTRMSRPTQRELDQSRPAFKYAGLLLPPRRSTGASMSTNGLMVRQDLQLPLGQGVQRPHRSAEQPRRAHQEDRLRAPQLRELPHPGTPLRGQAEQPACRGTRGIWWPGERPAPSRPRFNPWRVRFGGGRPRHPWSSRPTGATPTVRSYATTRRWH